MNSRNPCPKSSKAISIKEIFLAARELTAGEKRDRYLTEAVGDDQELRRRVERMLASEDSPNPKPLAQAVDNLDLAAYDVTTGPAIDVSEHPSIGPYKLLERLGTGGMGEVFVAEQRQPVRRTVALKLIKPGMDSKEVIARFEAERQALALMHHPNIASVLDVGQTDDGRPYFVMDLVRGVSITKYCDRHKLDLRQRLQLMVTVCQAVQHAHQKGIIHRDLKPGNILVELDDVRHVPKIIDFGVAKATNQQLTERTLFTQFSQMIGTPSYMSPEQTQMTSMDVDTRSDVYSLGVLLYELLTGSTPFDKQTLNSAGFDEMRRIIREDQPPRPSHRLSTLKAEQDSTLAERLQRDAPQLRHHVEAELDWIVMKALEKDRIRRYESASALAADVQRFLDGEPVEAVPPSTSYYLKKFARRNQMAIVATGVVVTSLIVGISVSLWQASEANDARDLADRRSFEAERQRGIAVLAADLAEENAEYSRQLVYAADVRLAAQAWQSGDARRFTDQLDRHRPVTGKIDRRGFEWRYLRQFGTADVRIIATNTPGGRVTRFSPGGKHHVTGRTDGTICFRDGASFERLAIVQGHEGLVRGIDFDRTGERMASIGDDGMICLWDLPEQKRIRSFRAHADHGFRVFFVADDDVLASCGEDTSVRLWNADTDAALGDLADYARTFELAAMNRSPDGQFCASGDPHGFAYVWDTQTHKRVCQLELGHRDGNSCFARCVCFSPDGLIVAIGTSNNLIRLCDAQTGKQLATFSGHEDDIQEVTFHPDGSVLASSDMAGVIRTWRLNDESVLVEHELDGAREWAPCFQAHSARISSISFSPDGNRLISVSNDGDVRSWGRRNPTGKLISGTGSEATSMAFGDKGNELYIATDSDIQIWNRQTQKLRRFGERFAETAFCTVNSPDRRTCVTGHRGGFIRYWNCETGQLIRTFKGHEDSVKEIAISPDNRILATGGWEGTVKLWEVASGDQLGVLHMPPHCYSVAFSPDGRLLACSSENDAMIFDTASLVRLHLLKKHRNSVECVAFSPCGRLLATGSEDRTIRIWNVNTGEVEHVVAAHHDAIYSLTFSPDGRTIVSGGKYGMIAFTHVNTGRLLFDTKVGNKPVNWLEFSPDGEILAATVKQPGVHLLFGPRNPANVRGNKHTADVPPSIHARRP